jgi:hypothetical protein
MLLDEMVMWMLDGGETTCETEVKQRMKHIVKRSSKHARGKNEKRPNPTCYIRGTSQIITGCRARLENIRKRRLKNGLYTGIYVVSTHLPSIS